MIQEFEAIKDDLKLLDRKVDGVEEVCNELLELVLALTAKVSAIEELLIANHILDEGSLKAVEECNMQEALYNLTQLG